VQPKIIAQRDRLFIRFRHSTIHDLAC
jgi:hypothetical protein